MKTVIRFLTASILVLTQLSIAQWVQTNGPKNSPEISFAAMGDSVLYCFDGRLKKITLGQDAWTIVPESYHFLGWMGPLAVCGSILLGYAENLSGQHFVYASTDGGGSWTSVLTDSTALLFYGGGRIPSLEIIGSTFFVSTPASFNNRPVRTPTAFRSNVELGGELFVSHDIGRTWKKVGSDSILGKQPKLKAAGPTLYTAGNGIHRTTDMGSSWQLVGLEGIPLNMIDVKNSKILTTFGDSVYYSVDDGANWETIWRSTDSVGPQAIALGENAIYVATSNNRILRSTDDGSTWNDVTGQLNGGSIIGFFVRGSSVGVFFNNAAFISADNGHSWMNLSNGLGTNWPVYSLVVSGSNLFAGNDGGVVLSTDNGTSWDTVSSGLNNSAVYSLSVNGRTLFAGTKTGLFRSTSNGAYWISVNTGLPTPTGLSSTPYVSAMVAKDASLFVGTSNAGVFLSSDSGTTWASVNSSFPSNAYGYYNVHAFAVLGSTLFAGTDYGVFASVDNGATWIEWNDGLQYGNGVNTLAVIGPNLFAGTYGRGAFVTTGVGKSWGPVNEGMKKDRYGNYYVMAFAIDGSKLYAADYYSDGIVVSSNNGNSWSAVNSGFPKNFYGFYFVNTLAICGSYLFAGTSFGDGLWRRPLSEMVTGVGQLHRELPTQFSLQQNYPNPFNPSTTIEYQVPKQSLVRLKVFDLLGREVATLVNEMKQAGTYNVKWNASPFSSGVYFYKLTAEGFVETKKMVLMK